MIVLPTHNLGVIDSSHNPYLCLYRIAPDTGSKFTRDEAVNDSDQRGYGRQ